MLGKRTISFITSMCFSAICFFTIPSFASTTAEPIEALSPDITTTSVTDSAINIEPSTEADNASDAAADGDISSTTGTALEVNTSSTPGAIDTIEEEEDESLWYSTKIAMKKEHQKLLWDYCKKRKLDYIDMLALISLESNFYEKSSSRRYKGYFQISTVHGPNLSKNLKTQNKPLDGAININWGTAMYSWIIANKRVKGLEGKKQRDTALSIFQRGARGYDKYGLNNRYLKKYYKKRDIIASYFEE